MAFPAIKPIYTYTDIDGRPLDDGYLYYGVANLDPEANPITVYWDAAETQPATQPIRTIGGYAVNAGVRAIVYAPSDYSVNVRNKNGSLVSTSPSELNDNPFTFIQSGTGAVATTVQEKERQIVSVLDFLTEAQRADYLGKTALLDITVNAQKALDAHLNVFLPAGKCLIDLSWLELRDGTGIYGAGISDTTIVAPRTTGASRGVLYANSGAAGTQLSDITLRDFCIDGQVETLLFSEFKHLVSLNGVKDALIDHVKFKGFRGDGLYIGSGVVAGDERHNTNVTVRGCIFDGVNSDNRNGITVIDCDGFHAYGNTFRNCTKSTMPGPIDIEPDGSAFHVVRNVHIHRNRIESYGGIGGIIVYLNSGPFTEPLFDVEISNNYIAGATALNSIALYVSTNETISASTKPMAVVINDNTVVDSASTGTLPFSIRRVRGYELCGNTFKGGSQAQLGIQTVAATTVMDGLVRDNMFYQNGNSSGALVVASADNLEVSGNTIDAPNAGLSTIGIRFFGDGVTTVSSNVKVFNNTFRKGASQTFSIEVSGHTLDRTTNTAYGNRVIGGALTNAFLADYGGADLNSSAVWTPVIAASGLTITQTGTGYIKYIGDIAIATFTVTVSAVSGAGAGGVTITGLPTAANATSGATRTELYISNLDIPATYSKVQGLIPAGTTIINCRQQGDNVADTALSYTSLTSTTSISGTLIYRT